MAHNTLGNVLSQKRLLKEAILAYQDAIRIKKDYANPHNGLGLALMSLGQLDEAIVEFREAIRIDKNRAAVHQNLGNALRQKGQLEEAIAEFRAAVRLAPENPATHNSLAWFLATCPDVKFRDPTEAVKSAKKAVELQSKAPYWNTLGVAQYRAGNWNASVEALQNSMDLSKGGSADDWFFLAMAYWQQGDKEQARKWQDRARAWMEKNKKALENDKPHQAELCHFQAEAAELIRP